MTRGRSVLTLLLLAATAALVVGAPSASGQQVGGDDWNDTATAFRGQNGARFVYTCPAYGSFGSVWGTDVYTDDSSVCTAAVHRGLITLAGGGKVTIEIRPGQDAYPGSTRNGVQTSGYGPWSGSYIIVGAEPQTAGVGFGGSTWDADATRFRQYVGARFAYTCPAGGSEHTIWGTNVYTDDSSVCTAAVHAGRISLARGGGVTIEMRPGQDSYDGSTRNGITSREYGSWGGSFVVLGGAQGGQGAQEPPDATATGSVEVNGRPFTGGEIPYGATVDVSGGRLSIDADVGDVTVYGAAGVPAQFKLVRPSASLVELRLVGGSFSSCNRRTLASAERRRKPVRLVWATGNGRFRTTGRDSSASVRGTVWRTEDRCEGTLTYVQQGVVSVRDFRRRRTVSVRAGQSYLAAHNPRRR